MSVFTKRCYKCGETKIVSDFHRNRSKSDGLQVNCKECHDVYNRSSYLARKYNLSIADYNFSFASQEGCCKICGIHQSELKTRLFVDYDAERGLIRSLLCVRCNLGLRNLGEFLQRSVDYLE